MDIYKVIGVMSGTSLDGLDLAYCEIVRDEKWTYKILSTVTIPYSEKRRKILETAYLLSGEQLTALDMKFGKYIGEECRKFMDQHSLQVDFISSHGHTIFHQPHRGFTLQIGNGANIMAASGIPVVNDFRTQDVALGGQGAPLVPIGDQLLFADYDACLNLGGFANISTQRADKRIAWDICAVNIVLNDLVGSKGLAYDEGGKIAASGKLNQDLLNDLEVISFYRQTPPKSLGREWVFNELWPVLHRYHIPVEDILHTYVTHIANQISKVFDELKLKNVLVTGGGVYNDFLIEKIREKTESQILIPDDATVQFKEALIFAFLGVLRWRGENNVLRSVTGAKQDHSSGVIYGE